MEIIWIYVQFGTIKLSISTYHYFSDTLSPGNLLVINMGINLLCPRWTLTSKTHLCDGHVCIIIQLCIIDDNMAAFTFIALPNKCWFGCSVQLSHHSLTLVWNSWYIFIDIINEFVNLVCPPSYQTISVLISSAWQAQLVRCVLFLFLFLFHWLCVKHLVAACCPPSS